MWYILIVKKYLYIYNISIIENFLPQDIGRYVGGPVNFSNFQDASTGRFGFGRCPAVPSIHAK
jgi:hypothetical protein